LGIGKRGTLFLFEEHHLLWSKLENMDVCGSYGGLYRVHDYEGVTVEDIERSAKDVLKILL